MPNIIDPSTTPPTLEVAAGDANAEILASYDLHMRTAKMAAITIGKRFELLGRLAHFLAPTPLLAATPADLERYQQTFAHLSANSIDIYSRHVLAFYKWAVRTERLAANPTIWMVAIRVPRGKPHPIDHRDLRMVLACARDELRLVYVLAAFAGLRRGEICRLRAEDLSLDAAQPVALIRGKGNRERFVPLLPPVVAELRALNLPRRGLVVQHKGMPYHPERLSTDSHNFLKSLGVESSLHSCRHYFATEVVKLTKDILLVRDLLGHSTVAVTQIYMDSSIDGAQDRLSAFSDAAHSLINNTTEARA